MTAREATPEYSPVVEILALRTQLKLSQAEFGEMLEVDQATVSRWEHGLQAPDPKVRIRLSELIYRLNATKGIKPEIALVEYSLFPMAIISQDWRVIALSDSLLRTNGQDRERKPIARKKHATADMEQAISLLRGRGFFEGRVGAARIVAHGFMLRDDQEPFEAICTPVAIDGEICRLMQYVFLSEEEFRSRRSACGLLTILDRELSAVAAHSSGSARASAP